MGRDREAGLRAAIDDYNRLSLAEFQLSTGLRYLAAGPVYLAGPVRVRALFVDPGGGHWCDADLVAESAYMLQPNRLAFYRGQYINLSAAHDLWVMTIERGRHDACVAPIADACTLLDLDPPVPFAPGWARSWRTFGWLDEPRALALAAAGPSEPELFEWRKPA